MTDTYYDERPVKRRTLALVALLALCMVSLTSVAYAYSTTVNIEDNPIADNYYAIDYTDDSGDVFDVPEPIPVGNDEIVINPIITYAYDANHVYGKVITPAINAKNITREFYVTFTTDMGADKEFTLTTSVEYNGALVDIMTAFVENSDAVYMVWDATADDGNGGTGAFVALDKTEVKNGDIIKIVLTLRIHDVADTNAIASITQEVDDEDTEGDLVALVDELSTYRYDVTVTVAPTP